MSRLSSSGASGACVGSGTSTSTARSMCSSGTSGVARRARHDAVETATTSPPCARTASIAAGRTLTSMPRLTWPPTAGCECTRTTSGTSVPREEQRHERQARRHVAQLRVTPHTGADEARLRGHPLAIGYAAGCVERVDDVALDGVSTARTPSQGTAVLPLTTMRGLGGRARKRACSCSTVTVCTPHRGAVRRRAGSACLLRRCLLRHAACRGASWLLPSSSWPSSSRLLGGRLLRGRLLSLPAAESASASASLAAAEEPPADLAAFALSTLRCRAASRSTTSVSSPSASGVVVMSPPSIFVATSWLDRLGVVVLELVGHVVAGQGVDERRGHRELLARRVRLLRERLELRGAHLVGPEQGLQRR